MGSSGGAFTAPRQGLENSLQKLTSLRPATSRTGSTVVSPLATPTFKFNAANYVNAAFDDIRHQSQPITPTYPPTPPPPRSSRSGCYQYKDCLHESELWRLISRKHHTTGFQSDGLGFGGPIEATRRCLWASRGFYRSISRISRCKSDDGVRIKLPP